MSYIQKYLKTVFNIDDMTSATIIITLFVFISGFLINQSIKYISKYMKRKNIRKMFLLNLHDLHKRSNKQAEKYKATASQFDFNHTVNYDLKRIDISQLTILKGIRYKDTYNAFFRGLKIYLNQKTFIEKHLPKYGMEL